MKNLLVSLVFFGALSQQAFAGCHDKCIIRNPINKKCAYEVRVCPLSTETIGRWLDGATPDTLDEAFKDIDPTKVLSAVANGIGVEGVINNNVTSCLVDLAAVGTFGPICAAGVAAVGPLCFAEITCVASCAASITTFKSGLETCKL